MATAGIEFSNEQPLPWALPFETFMALERAKYEARRSEFLARCEFVSWVLRTYAFLPSTENAYWTGWLRVVMMPGPMPALGWRYWRFEWAECDFVKFVRPFEVFESMDPQGQQAVLDQGRLGVHGSWN